MLPDMEQQLAYARRDPMDIVIENALIARERERQLGMWLRLLAGLPASFLAPFILASVAFAVAQRFHVALDFWPMFALLAAVLLPLIYWRARLHRTDFFHEAAADQGVNIAGAYRADSYGELELRQNYLSIAAWQELFFWGPYLVLEALGTWRADQSVLLANRQRAVQIIRELLAQETGVAPATLRQRDEPDAQFGRALSYLAKNDWIDLPRRRDRVWLLTEARERLNQRRTH